MESRAVQARGACFWPSDLSGRGAMARLPLRSGCAPSRFPIQNPAGVPEKSARGDLLLAGGGKVKSPERFVLAYFGGGASTPRSSSKCLAGRKYRCRVGGWGVRTSPPISAREEEARAGPPPDRSGAARRHTSRRGSHRGFLGAREVRARLRLVPMFPRQFLYEGPILSHPRMTRRPASGLIARRQIEIGEEVGRPERSCAWAADRAKKGNDQGALRS